MNYEKLYKAYYYNALVRGEEPLSFAEFVRLYHDTE